ncbi:MAG: hypothetical protein U0L19_04480 [Bacteroidales bacterium]|jgi:hypothetical protein|nr:hypothetical protein [Bacteroidales bacterium]
MSHRRIRKIKNRKHQILLSRKGNRRKRRFRSLCQKRIQSKRQPIKQGRVVSIKDTKLGNEFCPQMLLEYSSLFPHEELNIHEEISNFPREQLVKIVFVLGRNYGTYKISDLQEKPFFSYSTDLYRDRMERIATYIVQKGYSPDKVSYACERTLLEFLKLVFSVVPEDSHATYEDWDAEVKIFDILLAINEQKVTPYKGSKSEPNNLAQMMYVSMYATNEFANFNWKLVLAEQMFYARTFFEFITSRSVYSTFYQRFLSQFGICSWIEYFRTIALLSAQVGQNGVGVFSLENNDPEQLVNKQVLSQIAIDELETISVSDDDNDENRDFVVFRSRPIIHMQDGNYMIYNAHLVIERLYNSIYFDLLPYQKELTYKGKTYSQFYKEVFVEKYLLDNTLLSCIDENRLEVCFPNISDIQHADFVDKQEEKDQPDFYIREDCASFIFECKAIKLNGDLKGQADVDNIMEELKNKLVEKRWKLKNGHKQYLSSPKDEGVGQLVAHIERLENGTFKWDPQIPKQIQYYPILVLESREIIQPSLSAIINEWYYESLKSKPSINLNKCQPLIVMTIKTLFLYSDLFKRDGLRHYLDKFISDCKRMTNGQPSMSAFENFDGWMQCNYKSNKQSYYEETIKLLHP